MRDDISLSRVQMLHPAIRNEVMDTITTLENNAFPHSVKVRVVQGLRNIEEQNVLFAQGRTTPGPIVTNAKGGSSYHNYGLAFDFAIMYDKNGNGTYEALSWDINYDFDKDGQKDWQEIVQPFKALGYAWGGDWRSFKDNPHLEKTFGYSWQALLQKYTARDFIPGTGYVKL